MSLAARNLPPESTVTDAELIEGLLGKTPHELFTGIWASDGNPQVVAALALCARTLSALDAVDPSSLEQNLLGDVLDAVESEAITLIRDITSETNFCVARLMQLFPPPTLVCPDKSPDSIGEIDFDFFDDASTAAANDVSFLAKADGPDPSVEIALAIGMLSSMLRDDNMRFVRRIRARTDLWSLVGEVQDFRSRCCKCLQAIVTACLGACNHIKVTESALPRCQRQGVKMAWLRMTLVRLDEQVLALASSLQANPASVEFHRQACLRLIDAHMASAVWSDTPVAEKRNFAEFRHLLQARETLTFSQLERAIEGFVRFLELFRSNLAPREMAEHDVAVLKEALSKLDAGAETCECLRGATLLRGCDPELDGILAICESELPCPSVEKVRPVLQRVLAERSCVF